MGARNGYGVRTGYRPSGDDDKRFQSEAILESIATKAAVLMQSSRATCGVKLPSFFARMDFVHIK
ncbi:MAG: hypothetical protein ACI8ZB_005302 [Desulforhopalus sp.]